MQVLVCPSPHSSPVYVIIVCIENVAAIAFVDTGAAVTVIHAGYCRSVRKVMTPFFRLSFCTASAQPLQPIVVCTARVTIEDVLYTI